MTVVIDNIKKFNDNLLSDDPEYWEEKKNLSADNRFRELEDLYLDRIKKSNEYDVGSLITRITNMLDTLIVFGDDHIYHRKGIPYLELGLIIPIPGTLTTYRGNNLASNIKYYHFMNDSGEWVVDDDTKHNKTLDKFTKYELIMIYLNLISNPLISKRTRKLNTALLPVLNEHKTLNFIKRFNEI